MRAAAMSRMKKTSDASDEQSDQEDAKVVPIKRGRKDPSLDTTQFLDYLKNKSSKEAELCQQEINLARDRLEFEKQKMEMENRERMALYQAAGRASQSKEK